MRTIVFCIITGMLSGIYASCTRYMDAAERYVLGAAFCALQSEDDGLIPYRSVVTPPEFFDAKDFGRGHYSLYFNTRGRHESVREGFDNRRFRHHESTVEWERARKNTVYKRQGAHRNFEFSISERYSPLMLPDVEYNK